MTIGSYSEFKPQQAAEKVLAWINEGVDPLADKKATRSEAKELERKAGQRTLRYYLDNYYLQHMERSWKPANVRNTYGRISGHFAVLLDRDMATFDKADINDWQRRSEKKGLSYSTIRRSYGALKTLLRKAVNDGVMAADPLEKHKLLQPSIKDQKAIHSDPAKADRRLLTDNEIQGILHGLDLFCEQLRQQRRNSRAHGKPHLEDFDQVNGCCVHWFIPFCHLALHTGLRPGDLYSLTWQELNIPFGRLTKLCEKTSHAVRSGKKPAVVDMKLNPTIKQVMTQWYEYQEKPATGLVFASPRTNKQLSVTAHKKPWATVKELGGVDDNLNFYALRHHFISAMLAQGVPIFTVAKLAGHKSVEMIQQHYGHLCPDQAAEAIDIVARSISAKQTKASNRG